MPKQDLHVKSAGSMTTSKKIVRRKPIHEEGGLAADIQNVMK
jgi:hypothetical protein